jgi:type II secretory pathway pseudopilin PulG
MLKRARRGGFTKLELAVVLIVVVALIGLLLPAVQSNRSGCTRRMRCMSNQHNLGLALLAFEARMTSFPPGLPNCKTDNFHQVEGDATADCQGPNWLSQILPDVEEKRSYADLLLCLNNSTVNNVCNDCPQLTNSRVGTTTPRVFLCPSSPASELGFKKYGVPNDDVIDTVRLSKGSYAACFGAESYLSSLSNPELAGVFGVVPIVPPADAQDKQWMLASNQGTRLSDIADGSSKTLLLSEILSVDSPTDARGVWTWPGMGGSTFTGYQTPNSQSPDALPICDTTASLYSGPTDPLRCTREYRTNGAVAPMVHAAARSNHPGIVNVILADGSGHTINSDIDLKVWRALCTRAGSPQEQNAGMPE